MSLIYWGWHALMPCNQWLDMRAQVELSWDPASLTEYLGASGSSQIKVL